MLTISGLTFVLAGEGRGRFLTSIQLSESRSGKLADSPFGIVFRLLTSSDFEGTLGLDDLGDPGADSANRDRNDKGSIR